MDAAEQALIDARLMIAQKEYDEFKKKDLETYQKAVMYVKHFAANCEKFRTGEIELTDKIERSLDKAYAYIRDYKRRNNPQELFYA